MDLSTLDNVNVDDLMKYSAKKAAEICITLIENDRIQGDEILKYWSRKLLQHYGLLCTNEVLEFLLESILKYLTKVLKDREKDENFQYKIILEYIGQWQNIYTWIRTKIDDFNINSLSIFIENAIKTLNIIFSYSTQRNSNQNANIFKECLRLQQDISTIISENSNLFLCQVESCMEIIIKLTKLLCDNHKFVSMLDIKNTIYLWKIILKLYTDNAEFYKNNFEIDFEWIERPVKILCEEIKKSVTMIYENNIVDESINKVERIVKINFFYIKCLEKFAIDFDHNYFHGCSELLDTIQLILNIPKSLKGTQKENCIKEYLLVGLLNLINYIYKNQNFMNKLLGDKILSTADECANFCLIIIEVLKILALKADNDTIQLYLENKIMEKLFKNIPHSRGLLSSQKDRDELIGLVASLFLQQYKSIKVMEVFENLLSGGVLQNDFLLANICIDVCLVVVRFIHAENRYRYFKFWLSINEKFPKFSDSLQSVYTEYLVVSLYDLLPNNYKIQFWSSYFSVDLANDKRTLLTLGVNRIFDKTQQTIHKNKLQAELNRSIHTKFDYSIDKYYRVIEIMKLLCETNIDNTFLVDSLFQFWPLLSMDINLQKHDLFFRTLFKCCSRNIEIFPNNKIQNILLLIEKYASVTKSSDNFILNLQLYDFLTDIIEKKPIFNEKANSIQSLLRNNPENNFIQFLRLENLSQIPSTSKDAATPKNYLDNQFHIDFEHICKITDTNESSPGKSNWQNKKIRLDGEREIVKEALRSAEKIEHYFKYEKPNSMDIETIRDIIGIYGGVIEKNEL